MIGWIILAVLLLLVLLAFVVRLGVLVGYDDSGFRVKVRVGPQYIQTFPVARTPKKEAKKKAKQEKKAEKKKAKKEKKKRRRPRRARHWWVAGHGLGTSAGVGRCGQPFPPQAPN